MWEHRCKVAVSGVGFSRVTRSAEIPLAAHALEAVKGAVEDSGLTLADIDGLATYPELPATGHAVIDGVTIVSVNCMMTMLKLPNLAWHVQVETVNIGGADVHRLHLDVPGEVRQLQHRHHAVDGDDGDAVDDRVPRRRQLRIRRQAVDVGQGEPGVFDGALDRLERMRGQRDLRGARHAGEAHAAHRDLAPVLPH